MRAVFSPRRDRRAHRALPLLLCVPIVVAVSAAHAAADHSVRLTFVGAPGCDDPRAIEREIRRRSDDISLITSDAETTVGVRVVSDSTGVESVLTIDRAGRPPVTRTVSGASCEEVLEATALIIVVMLSPPMEPQATSQVENPTPPVVRADPAPESIPRHADPRHTDPRWYVGGGTAGVVVGGIAPCLLLGLEPFLELGVHGRGWAPALRMGARQVWCSGSIEGQGRASFRLGTGTASGCPFAWSPFKGSVVRACASASFGDLRASGSNAGIGRSENHRWVAMGGELRIDLSLARLLSLEFLAASEAAAVRSRFWLNAAIFHETAPIIGRGGVGLALRLP